MMVCPPASHKADFRFFAELNAFLPRAQRGRWSVYCFQEFPGIKDPIEALGVPHTELDLIIVNGASVDFSYKLQDGDRVAVYPRFYNLDTSSLKPLRPPLPDPAFVLDVHLGKLTKILRLLGIDVIYRNDFHDPELVDIAERDNRALLTRDRRLLFHRRVVHGRFVRNTDPLEQTREIISHFSLEPLVAPFTRCMSCNGAVVTVEKEEVLPHIYPKTARYYDEFFRCRECEKIYWKGPHFKNLFDLLRDLGVAD
ncbi:twitching motility protein PilT [Proteobacteria bacterium 005FR1]|nr:twitching motility protein PilT [Proteobacteria bacterium 005FR1]